MAKTFREGSAGEKEQKENRIIIIFASLVTIGILLLLFVIPNDLKKNVKAATTGWNVVGVVCLLLSILALVKGTTSPDKAKQFATAWLVLIGLGIFCACGWFGYTY